MKRFLCIVVSFALLLTSMAVVIADDTGTGDTAADPSIVLFDDLNDASKLYEYNNLGFFDTSVAVSNDAFPGHQDLNNQYKSKVARRDGGNSAKEASLTYSLEDVNLSTTSIEVGAFYFYSGGYAGGDSSVDTSLDFLNKSLQYMQLQFYESDDGINYTPIENVKLAKYPGPWAGQSSHFVRYTIKGLAEDTVYVKIVFPSIEEAVGAGVELYGWDPCVDSVTVKDSSAGGSVVTVVDDMDNASMMYRKSDNLTFGNQNVVSPLYPDHMDLSNPYNSNFAKREGTNSSKEAEIVYTVDQFNMANTEVSVDGLFYHNRDYVGGDPEFDTNLDYLNKSLERIGFKFYESDDDITYTEVENVKITKYPSPWPGQAWHGANFKVKGMTEGTQYFKIVIPSIENADVTLYGWDPMIDKITFTDRTNAGTTVTEVFDPMDSANILFEKSGNISFHTQNIVTPKELYPEHQDLANPYKAGIARRSDGGAQNDEAYLVYAIDENPANTKMTVEAFYTFNYGYAGVDSSLTSLDHLNGALQYLGFSFYESSDNVTYTPVENVTLKKLPGPWGGQSAHYVAYTVKGFQEDTAYVKMVIPDIKEAKEQGIQLFGWDPLIDSVKLTTTTSSGGDQPEEQKLKLANVYMNNMVLQANEPVNVTGMAQKDKTVTATLSDGTNTYTATAVADGKDEFKLTFAETFAPGYTPYTLVVTDGTTTRTYADILFGDVYLTAGQSNMAWPMSNYYWAEPEEKRPEIQADMDNANHQYLRTIRLAEVSAAEPTTEASIGNRWASVTSSNVYNISAISYYFGKFLLEQKDYPIGILDVAWGGTGIGSWIRNGNIYNNHVYPFKDFNIKGCLWYQGESDEYSPDTYAKRNIKLIEDYRALFGQDMPFCLVQLANYGSAGSQAFHLIREAQLDVFKHYEQIAEEAETQNNVGILSIIDQVPRDSTNIHPEGKKELAGRFVTWANAVIYGEGSEYAGPVVKSAVKIGGKIELTFNHVGGGLVTKDGSDTVGCFKINDADGNSYDVTGTISGKDKVVITTDVESPVSVEYAFGEYNVGANLMNDAGLAAPAFAPVTLTEEEPEVATYAKAGDATGEAGTDITVPVKVGNFENGIQNGKFTVTYDTSLVTYKSIDLSSDAEVVGSIQCDSTSEPGTLLITFAADQPITASDETLLFNLVFTAGETEGESDITITNAEYGINDSFVAFGNITNGILTVVEESQPEIYGDVTHNGKVNGNDAVIILKHIAGYITLSEDDLLLADYNQDGSVNIQDVVDILLFELSELANEA